MLVPMAKEATLAQKFDAKIASLEEEIGAHFWHCPSDACDRTTHQVEVRKRVEGWSEAKAAAFLRRELASIGDVGAWKLRIKYAVQKDQD